MPCLSENYWAEATKRHDKKLESDPLGYQFSEYLQMSGGRFLVDFREVERSEKILICRSQIKSKLNFWKNEKSYKLY